ncbi:cytochrome P450 [Streptomyces tricolor]|nr:cytochrome P450 [Streptomyces tricolor]
MTKVSLITGLEVWAVTDYHLIRQLLTDPADQLLAQARELPPST